jgi:hypothetical protein
LAGGSKEAEDLSLIWGEYYFLWALKLYKDLATQFEETRVANTAAGPKDYQLYQNYPNPFNPSTLIRYRLAKAFDVRIQIYNTNGQLVRTLIDGRQQAGTHSREWDGRNHPGRPLSSGIYLIRMTAEGFTQVRKMHLVK